MTTARARTLLRCPTCGHASPPKTGGIIVRIRAGGNDAPTRVLGRCEGCGKMKFLISERDDAPPSSAVPGSPDPADRERTLQELAAYLSENSMDIATVEAIAAAPCPESRKRHIAGLVAEGVLKPEEAIRMLSL